jgi:hypothetical protein
MQGSIGLYGGQEGGTTANLGNSISTTTLPNSIALAGGQGDVTVDTTGSLVIALQAKYSATPASGQNVRYFGSILERLGP